MEPKTSNKQTMGMARRSTEAWRTASNPERITIRRSLGKKWIWSVDLVLKPNGSTEFCPFPLRTCPYSLLNKRRISLKDLKIRLRFVSLFKINGVIISALGVRASAGFLHSGCRHSQLELWGKSLWFQSPQAQPRPLSFLAASLR